MRFLLGTQIVHMFKLHSTWINSVLKIKVKEAVVSDEFKANSAAITLGFLFRKGLLNADESKSFTSV